MMRLMGLFPPSPAIIALPKYRCWLLTCPEADPWKRDLPEEEPLCEPFCHRMHPESIKINQLKLTIDAKTNPSPQHSCSIHRPCCGRRPGGAKSSGR